MDQEYMKRAIELAKRGEGYTKPNPLVGAVIVKDNKIIGEGYHEFYGGPHAEVNAFRNAVEDVNGAKMYVTLEPCSHYGKTPPCALAIVKNGIKEVVIGMKDPNPLVAGRGISILEEAGIKVTCGVLEDEVKELNDIFIKYITTKLPFGIMKTAMTLDGKIAAYTGDSKWITNELSRKYVHQIRNRVSAIMVGIGTVLADDPKLTTRLEEKEGADPIRVIVDSSGRISLEAKVLNLNSEAKTIVVVTERASKEKIKEIEKKGAEVIITPTKNGRVDLKHLMKELGERDIDSVLLEGGSTLNYSALDEGIVDKVISFIAPKIVGGEKAKTPVGGNGREYMRDAITFGNMKVSRFGEDVMIEAYIKRGE
ncbi:bifunctional diaminohydroxyphosphoribosylaminopyrimidine deaminase/5-amino-6-(5-phosphoribosylamino)uracil reductase RibD [Clostridium ganghwense]|uniref:Riboflavin biosynthesis protein RibD n=1 Tax=Clostridium ganghwense TaxID=312089 RepID=A0ABT4CM84_9CLOT|nr:bifunctional diaminohydroxyphosphoribosylaminopyrimidine deaminase/5-amino-6-(5-phosphoribosylamino)uracil reductase RibD [Clostridium ganghwense]MCY6370155.1 bifunctional diaminohydroxyphosphoribosylaminopyrimidine deaminase/5-amino-6-(5-phosphoribosylamino)uracil reductase RibD [Clostridium ganghwense]